jgi:hypothetical protein
MGSKFKDKFVLTGSLKECHLELRGPGPDYKSGLPGIPFLS